MSQTKNPPGGQQGDDDALPTLSFTDILQLGKIDNRSGQEIYDAIMAEIEPELVSANVPLLTKKYEGESPEEKKARGERYGRAYQEYEKRYKKFVEEQGSALIRFKSTALKSVEGHDRKFEENHLSNLEQQMSSH